MTRVTTAITTVVLLAFAAAGQAQLKVNEFMADNGNTVSDPSDGNFDDWLEIYNAGDAEVELSDYFLTDDPSQPLMWPFQDTSIAAGGFLLVWADNDSGDAGLHTNFALSREGEFVGLYHQNNGVITAIDTLTYGAQKTDISTGRLPDGSNTFVNFAQSTPGASNTGGQVVELPTLFINEFMADNVDAFADPTDGSFDDWLEIYNAGSGAVNLHSLFLTDNSDRPRLWALPDSVLQPGEFLLIWADRDTLATGLHANFALSSNGEFLGLYLDSGAGTAPIDTLSFGPQASNLSTGRLPDGSATFKTFLTATPGGSNSGGVVFERPPLFINEFMAENDSFLLDPTDRIFEDWLEIYNAGTTPISLNTFFLTDNFNDRVQWPFPDTTIAPGSFLFVWADNDSGDVGLHTNFALRDDGEEIGLFFITAGETLAVDQTTYTRQFSNISYGRNPDAGEVFVFYDTPTPGSSNAAGTVFHPGGLTINEFMADNQSTIQDSSDGNFDDWLEIYNGSESELRLDNYFLTDSADDPTRWPLPEVTIAAGSFLLIWADGDADDTGLHTNFGLSRNGEFIGLYYSTGTDTIAIDTLTFGAQSPDISQGRLPDGGETFVFYQRSTPGASNDGGVIVSVEEKIDHLPGAFILWQNYPNPFNPQTEIRFRLERAGRATLTIFNLRGQRVTTLVNERLSAGLHSVSWDGSPFAAGVYIYTLRYEHTRQSRKLILLK